MDAATLARVSSNMSRPILIMYWIWMLLTLIPSVSYSADMYAVEYCFSMFSGNAEVLVTIMLRMAPI